MKFIYPIKKYRVIDGDTIEVLMDLGDKIYKERDCRLYGVDAPELNTAAGRAVKECVQEWLWMRDGQAIYVESTNQPAKWHHTFLGVVRHVEMPLNGFLVGAGLAKQYDGGKRSWTEEELKEVEFQAHQYLNGGAD